ncbi:MAG: response regulator transcription factor [Anaerolineales bacterium]|nr:response regulator transcription factor [Anaerolineales bacterium]
MIRILLVDDQELVCYGLQTILKTARDLEVVGMAHNGAQALEKIPATHPDVVLMDLNMPVMNGIQATREIRARHPHIQVLVLTTYDADEWVFDAIRSGAAGYLLKDTPREQLIQGIRDAHAGETPVDPAVARKLFTTLAENRPPTETKIAHDFNDRERDILRLLARGLGNNEIADELHLSEGTVRNYVTAMFTKLGVTNRTQAAIMALRYGVVRLEDV